MTPRLAHIWRHPIKGIGAETLDQVTLSADRPLPLDRAWAVLQEGAVFDGGWSSCRNFLRGAKGPGLMAVTARVEGNQIHLSHPERPDLTVDPSGDASDLIAWLGPIYPDTRPAPVALVAAPPQGMSDAPFPSVSVLNLSSLRALSQKIGQQLDPRRFRGNLWLEGLAPWEEFDLIGKTLHIGTTAMDVVEPIGRCRATEANPETGQRDANTLDALQDGWGHTNFGVYARVTRGGDIALGDTVEVTA
ncbi:MOSC domain-containing protein [Rhodophyticola sp. CCM32]|uniref:MOSC domain-containing protein n=1 Tax=Rhodophyticola sp. CCM32 TaxID=2916397 RepID=UPI00107F3A8E|nr:MOSC domain-containing protein [Rhodophyticola sp. CCM32]QBY02389.1 MOSC domain-containing protein [Rhodophyticola sp. CCM32]